MNLDQEPREERLLRGGGVLLDVQWTTDHLASLGAVDVPRPEYLERLAEAVALPQMTAFHPMEPS